MLPKEDKLIKKFPSFVSVTTFILDFHSHLKHVLKLPPKAPKALSSTSFHSPIHTQIHAGLLSRPQHTYHRYLGVQNIARGDFDTERGVRDWSSDFTIYRWSSPPPALQPPITEICNENVNIFQMFWQLTRQKVQYATELGNWTSMLALGKPKSLTGVCCCF